MPEVGVDGQRKLKAAKVLCIGAGGLGSPAAMYLAAAGVGTHRHRRLRRRGLQQPAAADPARHAGRRPLEARSRRRIGCTRSTRTSTSRRYEVGARRPRTRCELFEPYDVILDGTDNFPTRYLVNDACVLLGKPNAYGSIFRFEGQASVFATKDGPCYRCLYPEPPPPGLVPSCAEGGVLGVLPGIIGVHPGDRGDQADSRHRRAAHRPLPDLRRAADEVPRAEAAEGSRLPGVRHAPDRDEADRLRAVLRRASPAAAGGAAPCPTTANRKSPPSSSRRASTAATTLSIARRARAATSTRSTGSPGSTLIPLGDMPRRVRRARPEPTRSSCSASRACAARARPTSCASGVQERPEPQGRDPGLDRQG